MTQDELLALIDQAAAEGWKELDLSGQGLTELPPELGQLTQLETLILGKVDRWDFPDGRLTSQLTTNSLTDLPVTLKTLKGLRTLDLSGNPFGKLPEVVLQLETLTALRASAINLKTIPDGIGQLTKLIELKLSCNQITEIPKYINQLTDLEILSFSSNRIIKIYDFGFNLKELRSLGLSSNQISEIPEYISQFSTIETLWLSDNKIENIPDYISELTSLKKLSLSHNKIQMMPDCITQLRELRELWLVKNEITEIPNSLEKLRNLEKLDLSANKISIIPEGIGKAENLTHLWLNYNQIKEIPDSIGNAEKLVHFTIGNNQIHRISECIGNLIKLENLGLSRNDIDEMPDSIQNLKNLKFLTAAANKISKIPPSIEKLSKLEKLWLHNNQIAEIPEFVSSLENLAELILDENKISIVPGCLGRLNKLSRLSVAKNSITRISEMVIELESLTYLDLRHNPIPVSPEIISDPNDIVRIFSYYRQLHSGVVRPLNEAKLVVIGQGSVGKTSLVYRLIDDRFDENESQTDGLNRRNWSVNVNSKDVRLNVWDFGGQEIYHATHQFFLTKRSLYLLVCNCRTSEEENRLEYWLKLIQSFGGESPVIIVGNKKDEQPLDINRKALRTKYPNIRDILETSCQSGDGIEELRAAILTEVAQLHDVYNLLPLSWFTVKERLEAMDRDFISYPEYIGICYQHQIQEEHNQEQLIELLHNLGLVLNFREHPLLKDTNVLNPGWVTAGIYQLLSDEILKTETKGILTDSDLRRILDAERYPADRYHYLTDLMQEFQLCFELPDCPSPKFLIPGLLPKDEPKQTDLEGNTLEFQYHYGILPEGVMSRFIVLSHEDIHNEVYWRSGVMLADREGEETPNIARIKADPEDNKIFIAISGREQTCRSMLSQIRKTFTKIHRSFANLNVTEWVPVPDYPEHQPLDYQELLGLEAMNEETVTIGKLRLRLNLRKLLDGYESMEARLHQQAQEFDVEAAGMQPNVFNIERAEFQMPQQNTDARSSTTHQHGKGDNFAGDQVQGDKSTEP